MDAEISASGLSEEFNSLLESGDFEGCEELLASALGAAPRLAAFLHYQYGRLYSRWNKLTSALNHLNIAAEMAQARGDELFLIQVVDELRSIKRRQVGQRP